MTGDNKAQEKVIRELFDTFGEFVTHSGTFNAVHVATDFLSDLSFVGGSGVEMFVPDNMLIRLVTYDDGAGVTIGGQLSADQSYEIVKKGIDERVEMIHMVTGKRESAVFQEAQRVGEMLKRDGYDDNELYTLLWARPS